MKDLEELMRVLQEELKLYGVLAACLERQRDAIVHLDRRGLEASTLELDALVLEVRSVASARAGMVARASEALGRKGESLRDLAETAPEPYRTRFAALRRDLLAGVRRMEGVAGASRTLVQDSLAHIRTFVRLLAGLAGPSPVYALPRSSASIPLMDRSA